MSAGLIEVHLHAGYLGFSLPTCLIGVLSERIVNISPLFQGLRGHVVGHFVRATVKRIPSGSDRA